MSRRISPVTTKAISTDTLQEIRRIKQYLNLLASWCHHRAPNLDILICVKDHVWFTAWWHTPYNRILLLSGTNIGIILSKLDTRALPAAAPLPTPAESKEHSAVYIVER